MRYYSKPDLNAPRHRPKRYIVLNNEFVERLYVKHPYLKKYSINELRSIIGALNTKMWKTVIDVRDGIELFNNLGTIFIGSCERPTRFNKDYVNSKTYETDVRHRNFESDEKLAKIFYTNYAKKYLFKNRELWEFNGHRLFTRSASKAFTQNWNRYIQLNKTSYISRILKK